MKNSLKKDNIKPIWCPGCGLYATLSCLDQAMVAMGWNYKNTVIVSGIGCTARGAGYFALDSVNALHGRAIPVAEGIKLSNPRLNVVVFSGDGDLLSIGGNHLLHTSRRNTNIKIICAANEVYGMTGGQTSPVTPRGAKTITSPQGAQLEPLNVGGLISNNSCYFFGRSTVVDLGHLKNTIKESFTWPGFSLVEVHSVCIGNAYATKNNLNGAVGVIDYLKNNFVQQKVANKLEVNEVGIIKNLGH